MSELKTSGSTYFTTPKVDFIGVWFDGKKLTPKEAAEYVFKSKDLIENPFESGSLEFKLFVDRLLELTSEAGNE